MSDGEIVMETAESDSGCKRWRLFRRSHGFFLFEEVTLQDEVYRVGDDDEEGVMVTEAYWMPTHVSGLFATEEAARQDALASLPWLLEALTKGS